MPRLNQSILQKAKDKMNRAFVFGSSLFCGVFLSLKHQKRVSLLALCLSLFLVGSCNESTEFLDFSEKPANLQQLSKSDLVRYGYALQMAILQKPNNIKKLSSNEVKLAFSTPDLERKDGRNAIWQYRTQGCVLDVYLKNKGAKQSVSHFEIRQRRSVLDGTQAVVDPVQWQCVQTVIQERRRAIDNGFSDIYADLSLKAHKS